MAKIEPLSKFILSWEGGYVNNPNDKGGATNKGVTIATWRRQGYDKNHDGVIDVNDLRIIDYADARKIMKENYWDRWKADQIGSQALANLLVDWLWSSGVWGIKIPQDMLGCKADGVVGPKTLRALGSQDPVKFFNRLKERREQYLLDLVKSRPTQKTFLKGWLRRLNAIQYNALVCNGGTVVTW